MKIKFTLFNGGQEDYEFDTQSLKKSEKLNKFLINKDENGKIYIVPMVTFNKYTHYPLSVLEKIPSLEEIQEFLKK